MEATGGDWESAFAGLDLAEEIALCRVLIYLDQGELEARVEAEEALRAAAGPARPDDAIDISASP